MAKPKKIQKTGLTWKKKKWYRVLAPDTFRSAVIGETPVFEESQLIGRSIKVNLGRMMQDMKKQNINVTFEINRTQGGVCYTCLKKYQVLPSTVKRNVRRGTDRIDDSFMTSTKDKKLIKIKPFLLTRSSVNNSVKTALRKAAKQFLVNQARNLSYDILVSNIISYKLQKEMRMLLQKIYPLKNCEIRMLSLEKEKKRFGEEVKEEKVEEPKQEEVKEEKVEEPKKEEAKGEKVEEEKKQEKSYKKEEVKEEKEKEEKVEEVQEKIPVETVE